MSDKLIYQKLAEIQKATGAIGKDQRNTTQNFMFRGIDAIYNALHPILAEHEIVTVPKVLNVERTERTTKTGSALLYSIVTMQYTFYATDGSYIECSVVGEGMDSGDKATNKAMAIAHKYALTQVFTLPYEGSVDPDSESHQVRSKVEDAIAGLIDIDTIEELQKYWKANETLRDNPQFKSAVTNLKHKLQSNEV